MNLKLRVLLTSERNMLTSIPLSSSFKCYMSWACNYRCTHTVLNIDVVFFQLTQLMLDEKFRRQVKQHIQKTQPFVSYRSDDFHQIYSNHFSSVICA